jgi:hypothetical protein
MPLATAYLTWFLAVAGTMHGHNNEVGGAARVTAFRQMIRFRLDERGLTGHVIAVEHTVPERGPRSPWQRIGDAWRSMFGDDPRGSPARQRGATLKPRLLDRFTIAP